MRLIEKVSTTDGHGWTRIVNFQFFKASDKYLSGAFCLREFLAQLAQLLCQNFLTRHIARKIKITKHIDSTSIFMSIAVGISQAIVVSLEQKHSTNQKS
jgi:hypothetical protein